MPSTDLRAEFPVLERVAYLNAGTDGPIPRRAAAAASERARFELEHGRAGRDHRSSLDEMRESIRRKVAGLHGCAPNAVALTHSTTDGLNSVLSGLDLRRGDEVLTTAEEHPGLLAPLAAARARSRIKVRCVPFSEIAGEVRRDTRLVACSHVSWVSGQVVDAGALASTDAPIVLDGAQGLGGIPADVSELGCDFYAAAGQKWLCGPDGAGSLFVRPDRVNDLFPSSPGYESLAEPGRPLDLELHPGAARFDRGAGAGPPAAWLLASLTVLEEAGWDQVLDRGIALAARLAERLRERGVKVVERGPSTLVSWRHPDPTGAVERLASEGFVVRDIPGQGLVRASVGAWSSVEELERLAERAV